jgi:hypothetical protein
MDRRHLILASGAVIPLALAGRARAQTPLPPARQTPQDGPPPPSEEYPQDRPAAAAPPPPQPTYAPSPATDGPPPPSAQPNYPATTKAETYSREELVNSVSDFLGVTAEAAGAAIERIFRDNGRPTGYIAGEEGSAAFIGGLRYGKGLLYMKNRKPDTVYWQGPSIGFDWGGNASRVFTLCYGLQYPDAVYRRFPGVEGSAYLVGGLGVNYQRAEDIVLAPMRAGVGLRLGANVGYLSYSRRRHWFPL